MHSFHYVRSATSLSSPYLMTVSQAGRTAPVESHFLVERDARTSSTIVHYVTAGQGTLWFDGMELPLAAGDLFVLPPGRAHRYGACEEDPFSLDWLVMEGGDSTRLAEVVLEWGGPLFAGNPAETAHASLKNIFGQLQQSPPESAGVSKQLYGLLVDLLSWIGANFQSPSVAGRRSSIRRALAVIETGLGTTLSVEQLAEAACLSPTYFAKTFRRVLGMTPATYITHARIAAVKEQLIRSEQSLEGLSETWGFSSASHLIRVFKKIEGLSPGEFRRKSQWL